MRRFHKACCGHTVSCSAAFVVRLVLSGKSYSKGKGQSSKGGGKGSKDRGPKSWDRSWGKKDAKQYSSSSTWDRKW